MMLSPQRNLPGIILLCAGLLFAGIGLMLPLFLSEERGATDSDVELPPIPEAPDPLEAHHAEGDLVQTILTNPIFFNDRQLPQRPVEEDDPEEPEPEVEVASLEATVSGVIITPSAKLAMVKLPNSPHALVLKEGMTLDGELAAWRVGEIQERSVNFSASDGQVALLELEVRGESLAPPPKLAAPVVRNNQAETLPRGGGTEQEQKERQANLAEEVRRRIAERRAQLRAQRQQQLEQNQDEDEN